MQQARQRRPRTTRSIAGSPATSAYYAKDYDGAIAQLTQGNLDDPFILDPDRPMAYEAKGDMTNARQDLPARRWSRTCYNLQAAIARPHARAKLRASTSQ